MLPSSRLCIVSLILATLSLLVAAQDPFCRTGLRRLNGCCLRKCGTCGGVNCAVRGRANKTACCPDGIARLNRPCNRFSPPCTVSGRNGPRVNPGGSSSTKGSWITAPVRSGSLVKRHEACAVMVRGLVVLLGGRGANKPVSLFNPKTRTWTTRNGPGQGVELNHMQCVATGDGKVYVVSSWYGRFPYEKNNDKIWIYDVPKNQWSTRAGMPAYRRRGGAAAILRNGVIYVIGGNRGGHGAHATSLSWMDGYNIAQNKWTVLKPFPASAARDHTGGALVKGQLCIAGGRNGGSAGFFNLNVASTWCYNFASNQWAQKANFPTPRAGANTGLTCDGRMMITGGEGNGRAYNLVHVFDGNSWTQGPPMKQGRHGSGLAVANCACGQIFVPSGSGRLGGSPELLTTEQFVPDGKPQICAQY